MPLLVAVDAGTTSVRALAVDVDGQVVDLEARALRSTFPAPGLVEQDPSEILALVDLTLDALGDRLAGAGHEVAAVGITNQRETTVVLDRAAGPVAPAIVWQDRRGAPRTAELTASGEAISIRAATGLPQDPYFSATKMEWLVRSGATAGIGALGLCTVDTLVAWHLTGGPAGGRFVTDASNASRTMLYDLARGDFSDELCEVFSVPREALATVVPSAGLIGTLARRGRPLDGVPLCAVLGDQQAALLGERCTAPGEVKATFGTGAFLLANAGAVRPADVDGLVTTVAWDLADRGGRAFALEGAAFVAGAAIQWLGDELGLLERPADAGALAASVDDAGGVAFVPALSGLGSPFFDADARGAIVGLSSSTTRAHLVRATVEALAFEARAMLDAMGHGGVELTELRIDGGAAAMDLLCGLVADTSGLVVRRARSLEATAIGAALCAGIGVGLLGLDEVASGFDEDRRFVPQDHGALEGAYTAWLDAVERTRAYARRAP